MLVSASLIPFLEHDDANRALMGANMMRQAVPLLITDPHTSVPAWNASVRSRPPWCKSPVPMAKWWKLTAPSWFAQRTGHHEYNLRKFHGLNERTCLNQKPIVNKGDRVTKGQILADGGGANRRPAGPR